jgi:maleate isomerase
MMGATKGSAAAHSRPTAGLGLIVPEVNFVVEPEFAKVLAPMMPDVRLHVARVSAGDQPYGVSALQSLASGGSAAALTLASVSDVIAFACTSASFVGGCATPASLRRRIEDASGRPAVITAQALVDAVSALDTKRLSLATPYTREVTELEQRFLEASGYTVVSTRYLGIDQRGAQGHCQPEEVLELARSALHSDAEALIISCTNLRTLELIDALERELGLPVVTSNQATLWALLRCSGDASLIERVRNSAHLGQLFNLSEEAMLSVR